MVNCKLLVESVLAAICDCRLAISVVRDESEADQGGWEADWLFRSYLLPSEWGEWPSRERCSRLSMRCRSVDIWNGLERTATG